MSEGQSRRWGRAARPILTAVVGVSLTIPALVVRAADPAESTTTTLSETTTTTVLASPTTTTPPPDVEEPAEVPPVQLLDPPSIFFPLVGSSHYTDTFGASRDGGVRLHTGTDIFAERGTPVIAAAGGKVVRMDEGPKAGRFIEVRHSDGWVSMYLHLNNDNPDTDDGRGVGTAPGIHVGSRVRAGTLLGYVGDSGNAEDSAPHLHFELHQPDGYRINPYGPLRAARRVGQARTPSRVDYDSVEEAGAEFVAHLDPDGTGFNADLAISGQHVFMGTWGNRERCPATGVRVIDISHPATPAFLTRFAARDEFPRTSTPSLWVGDVNTKSYTGRIGVVAVRACDVAAPSDDASDFGGLAIYDLADPVVPRLISVIPTGSETLGVDDVAVLAREGRLFAAATVAPSAEAGRRQSTRFYDLTNPGAPNALSEWVPDRDTVDVSVGRQDTGDVWRSRIEWLDRDSVEVTFQGLDLVTLDVSDPLSPRRIEGGEPLTPTRQATEGGVDRLTVPEGDPVFDDVDDRVTAPIGSLDAGRSVPYGPTRQLRAGLLDGVRLIDSEDPEAPVELAHFIPAPSADPQQFWSGPNASTEFPMVWDLVAYEGLVYGSDHNSGLWIFELSVPVPEQAPPIDTD